MKIKDRVGTAGRGKFSVNKNFLMLFIALGLGSAGVYFANDFINNEINSIKNAQKADKMVKVVVPNRNLERGWRIRGSDLAIREMPAKFIHKGVVTTTQYQVAEGQRLTYSIDQGKPLLWAHLESGKIPTFSGKLPEGYRALTFPVDKINSISGFLQPKDKIDLILTYKPNKKELTRPLIQNLLVLATGVTTTPNKMGTGKPTTSHSTLTVQVTPKDAERIILAQSAGKLTAVLRHPDDKELSSKKPMTVATLFGEKVKRARRIKTKKKKGVEFIIGGR